MRKLKSADFADKKTVVYGCGVERKTERGYHPAVTLDNADVQIFGMRTKGPLPKIKMQSGPSK